MAVINSKGRIQRKIIGKKNPNGQASQRDWYFAKDRVYVGEVHIPEEYWGKHIRFMIEVVERRTEKERI